jgi:hypothetical protein
MFFVSGGAKIPSACLRAFFVRSLNRSHLVLVLFTLAIRGQARSAFHNHSRCLVPWHFGQNAFLAAVIGVQAHNQRKLLGNCALDVPNFAIELSQIHEVFLFSPTLKKLAGTAH